MFVRRDRSACPSKVVVRRAAPVRPEKIEDAESRSEASAEDAAEAREGEAGAECEDQRVEPEGTRAEVEREAASENEGR